MHTDLVMMVAPAQHHPPVKALITRYVAHGLSEVPLIRETLQAIKSYEATLPPDWSDQDRQRVTSSLVGHMAQEVINELRVLTGASASTEPPGARASTTMLQRALAAYELGGDSPAYQAILDGEGDALARAYNGVLNGSVKPHWPLAVSPRWYISRHPKGEFASLAKRILTDDPDRE